MKSAPKLFLAGFAAVIMAGAPALGVAAAKLNAGADPRNASAQLAKSLTIDTRCKILSESERQDLRDLVARAEIALASRFSVKVARETLGKGRAEGKLVPCDAAAASQVKNIFNLARQAVSVEPAEMTPVEQPAAQQAKAAPTQAPLQSKSKPEEPRVAAIKPPVVVPPNAVEPAQPATAKKPAAPKTVALVTSERKKAKPVQPVKLAVRTVKEAPIQKKSSLASYSNLAEDYYVELKCRSMSLSAAQRMYNDVLAQHRAALATGGAAAVRKMLRQAQNRAGQRSCG